MAMRREFLKGAGAMSALSVLDPNFLYRLFFTPAHAQAPPKSLDWLENSVDLGFINYPFLNEYDPFLESIRGEKRFKELMKRVKYEWEHFDV